MGLDAIADELRSLLDRLLHVEWLSTAITAVVILLATALVSFLVTRFVRGVLGKGKLKLPSSTIFVNVCRIVVWAIGVSVVLASCFNINVGALVTALGIGGIAISLGFQDTLSNLIGGLQVSVTGLVKPGDHIQVGTQSGVVRDVTWRHTSIINGAGQRIVIPNSNINTQALIKLRPVNDVATPLFVTRVPDEGGLNAVAQAIEQAAAEALDQAGIALKKAPQVTFGDMGASSFNGTLAFTVTDSRHASAAKDSVVRTIAPYVHGDCFAKGTDAPDYKQEAAGTPEAQAARRRASDAEQHRLASEGTPKARKAHAARKGAPKAAIARR